MVKMLEVKQVCDPGSHTKGSIETGGKLSVLKNTDDQGLTTALDLGHVGGTGNHKGQSYKNKNHSGRFQERA